MKQYCRYCNHCINGDAVYCEVLKITMSEGKAKRVNNCNEFDFNVIDVFDLDKRYKPRPRKATKEIQERLF